MINWLILMLYKSLGFNNRIVIQQSAPLMLPLQVLSKECNLQVSHLYWKSLLIHLFPGLKKLFNVWSVLNLCAVILSLYFWWSWWFFLKQTITSFTQFTPTCLQGGCSWTFSEHILGATWCWVLKPLHIGDHTLQIYRGLCISRTVQTPTDLCRSRPNPTLLTTFWHTSININFIFLFPPASLPFIAEMLLKCMTIFFTSLWVWGQEWASQPGPFWKNS